MSIPSGQLWEQALAQVPGIAPGAAPDVQMLAGGTSNATFRVRTAAGDFVVRLHEPYSLHLGVDRRREAILHRAAAQAGLASAVVAADPAGRFMVSEYLPGQPWRPRDLEDETRLSQLCQTLNILHSLPAPSVAPVDLLALLAAHEEQIEAAHGAEAPLLRADLERARAILAQMADAGRRPCIIHGDLAHGNMIGSGIPMLIDWEYAAVADPLLDLACLAAYYPPVLRHAAALLPLLGLPASVTVAFLEEVAWVYRLLSDWWSRRLELARRHPAPAH